MDQVFAQALSLLESLHYVEEEHGLIDRLFSFMKLCQDTPSLATAYNDGRNLSMMLAFLEKRSLFKEEEARKAYLNCFAKFLKLLLKKDPEKYSSLNCFAKFLKLLLKKEPEKYSSLTRVDACKMTFFDHLKILNDPDLLEIYRSNPKVQALSLSPT